MVAYSVLLKIKIKDMCIDLNFLKNPSQRDHRKNMKYYFFTYSVLMIAYSVLSKITKMYILIQLPEDPAKAIIKI